MAFARFVGFLCLVALVTSITSFLTVSAVNRFYPTRNTFAPHAIESKPATMCVLSPSRSASEIVTEAFAALLDSPADGTVH